MLLVASVALSIMLSNDLILPALWRLGWLRRYAELGRLGALDSATVVVRLNVAIYAMYRLFAGDTQLASIGVLSLAVVAQLHLR